MTPEQTHVLVKAAQDLSAARNQETIMEIFHKAAAELAGHEVLLQSLKDLTSASIENCNAFSKLELRVQKSTEQLEELNKELDGLTYSISHDLRAPLRAVNGFAEILRADYYEKLDEEGKDTIDHITNGALKMSTLIDNLLSFSRLGRKKVAKVTIDMNELTEGAISELEKSVRHHAKITWGNLGKVEADYELLHQAVLNLISNAVKYSSKKEQPEITITSEQHKSDYVFSVKDNGAGFNMKYSDKLFGTFQRLHSDTEFEGVGIGLSLVKRIINKHGGKTWATGEVDKGATFSFSLPM